MESGRTGALEGNLKLKQTVENQLRIPKRNGSENKGAEETGSDEMIERNNSLQRISVNPTDRNAICIKTSAKGHSRTEPNRKREVPQGNLNSESS